MFIIVSALIVFFIGKAIVSNWRKKEIVVEGKVVKTEVYYKANCHNCPNKIDSRVDRKCTKCKYYVCSSCGKCLCDRLLQKDNDVILRRKWKKINEIKLTETKNRNWCISCGRALKPGSNHTRCYECWKKRKNPVGLCSICGKKLQGDTSKKYCHSCWSSRIKQKGYCSKCGDEISGDRNYRYCYKCWSQNKK